MVLSPVSLKSHLKERFPQRISILLTCRQLSVLKSWRSIATRYAVQVKSHLISAANRVGIGKILKINKQTNQPLADLNSVRSHACVQKINDQIAEEWKYLADNFLLKLPRNQQVQPWFHWIGQVPFWMAQGLQRFLAEEIQGPETWGKFRSSEYHSSCFFTRTSVYAENFQNSFFPKHSHLKWIFWFVVI